MSKLQLFDDNQPKAEELKKLKPRHWAVTWWKKPDFEKINKDKVRYAIAGEEICPNTGKVHWQGYVELYNPQLISGIKNIFNDKTMHCGVRFKSRDNARNYCMKDNKYEEYGYWISGQGFRSDLFDACEVLKNGGKLSDVIEDNPKIFCQYRNGIKDIAAHYSKKRAPLERDVEVILLTGPSGCGKTTRAMRSEENIYKTESYKLALNNGCGWWQDYDEEKTILIDEFNHDVKITNFITFIDKWRLQLAIKGSHTYAFWNKVYVTTNLRPEQIYPNALPEHRRALFRRMKIISYWDNPEGEIVTNY